MEQKPDQFGGLGDTNPGFKPLNFEFNPKIAEASVGKRQTAATYDPFGPDQPDPSTEEKFQREMRLSSFRAGDSIKVRQGDNEYTVVLAASLEKTSNGNVSVRYRTADGEVWTLVHESQIEAA